MAESENIESKKGARRNGNEEKKHVSAAVLAAVALLGVSTVTTFAALHYLAPDSVAEKVQQPKLEAAFEGDDAIWVNETQSYGGYQVTFMGVVSGENLTAATVMEDGTFYNDKTYAVAAIENADGTPMPEISEDAYGDVSFFVSPLIGGYNPVRYNAATMHGGYQEICEDGVLYRIAECDNVEIFADRDLYLCVVDKTFLDAEDDGGLNLEMPAEVKNIVYNLDSQNSAEYGSLVKSIVCTPDKKGYFTCDWELEGRGGGSETTLVSALFTDGQTGTSEHMFIANVDDINDLYWKTYTLNTDGTVTVDFYVAK